jgi:deoxyadenosine/deoxycytidine kinase
MMMMKTRIISIEGNIGSGKTRFLSFLKNKYKDNKDIIFLDEPVEDWETIKDENGITILEKFYDNPSKYSFSFQMLALISRLSIMTQAIETNVKYIITERCLLTDKCIFAKMLYDSGKIEKVEFDIYNKWFKQFNKYSISNVIYIKTLPDVCLGRVKQRSRSGENIIPIEYLANCHTYHENYIFKLGKYDNLHIQVIDGNMNIGNLDYNIYIEWSKYIDEIILQI